MSARGALDSAGALRRDVILAPLTTYKVGGPARWFVEAASEDQVAAALRMASEEELPLFVLGRGSNVVVSDLGFDGLVLRLGEPFGSREVKDDGTVTAGGSVPLPVLARDLARAGRGGLEFFSAIPGTVGGAVRMNAGCHGSDTSQWLLVASVASPPTGAVRRATPEDLRMSYRYSDIRDDEVVLSARFKTVDSTPTQVERRIREMARWRRRHQPGGTLNAGSAFKNPPGDSAGRIIDSLGLKGFSVGAAEVSRKHANFFVANEGATAADLHGLVVAVRSRVAEETGIELEPEVRFVGEFR